MSGFALLRRVDPTFFLKLRTSIRAAPSLSRCFNTNLQAVPEFEDNRAGSDASSMAVQTRRPAFFQDMLDPLWGGGVMKMMDPVRRGWDVKENEEALFFKMEMPGLGKEDVKIVMEGSSLSVKGEGGEEDGKYSTRLDLPLNVYRADEIKAEMKNGVLKLVVPKVKEEDKKDVVHVKID